jgi:hypothetical protein
MRRYMTALCVVGLVGAGAAATALAGAPRGGQSYSGSGPDRWLQGGTWVKHGTGSFSFGTDKRYLCGTNPKRTCQYIVHFRGTYRAACSTGVLHVRATNISISRTGTFNSGTLRGSNGVPFTIWGTFQGPHGSTAKVNYRARISNTCQSWVRGTALPG